MSHAMHAAPTSFLRKYVFATDHKVIGMQYLITGILMALVGGFLSYLFRMQLAFPGESIPGFGKLAASQYNIAITMHGTIMVFWVAMPILLAAFGNFLIPLMVGADDMAFPTLNMMSYQVFFISTVVLLVSFFVPGGAFAAGWTAYPPLSAGTYAGSKDFLSNMGGHLWIIAIALEFIAFLMGGINFLVTSFNMRAPGLSWFRLPVVVWMLDLAVLLFMFSIGPLLAGAIMLLFDRTVGTGFYDPAQGGDPILFQHLFWFFGHPEVYVMLLPTLGFLCEILATFARKPIFGYKYILYFTFGAALLSFIVWAHHQFVSGINPRMANFFSLTTLLISVPFTVIVFASIATLWRGNIQFSVPMLWAVGFVAEFMIGGVTGVYLGSSAFDIYAHDTYFVIAHFHYALIPTVVFGGFAAIHFWYPKFMGRMPNETLGKWHFWITAIAFNGIFLPLFFTGLMGEHRRIFDYSAWPSLMTDEMKLYRKFATTSLLVLLAAQPLFFINMIYSYFKGAWAVNNPYKANSLEWSVPSPPPHGNFPEVPTVYRGAYEFSVPGREADYWPQDAKS